MGMLLRLLMVFCLLTSTAVAKERSQPQQESAAGAAEKEPDTTADDQKTLRDVGLSADGPALLDYFKKRTFPEADPKRVAALIQNLGDEDFEAREKAHRELLNLGSTALVALKQVERHPDVELQRRVMDLRQKIEAKAEPHIQGATARLVAKTRPPGAAQVLLNYLPFAADQHVTDEVCKALGALAVEQGKVEPALIQALSDKIAVKRGGAAEALARAKVAEHLTAVRKLLHDPEPSVRLRVGLALVPHKEKEVIPVFISLLGQLAPEQLWPVEEILVKLAGDGAPTVPLGTNEVARKQCEQAWNDWFKNQKQIDLAKLDEPTTMLGYTLIVQQSFNRIGRVPAGQVLELDRNKNEKWKFDVPTTPVDAQVVGPDRVLVVEYQGGRVTERDFRGNIHWEKATNGMPIGAQRMPNGNTFVNTQQMLAEYDRKGHEVWSYHRPQGDMFRARKLRNGEIVFITSSGLLVRMDQKNQQTQSFQVGQPFNLFGAFDVLPNGNVVVAQQQNQRVVEFDRNGGQVNTYSTNFPNSVVRMPNGHLLVSSINNRRVVELDRNGREVWSHSTADTTIYNARRR